MQQTTLKFNDNLQNPNRNMKGNDTLLKNMMCRFNVEI